MKSIKFFLVSISMALFSCQKDEECPSPYWFSDGNISFNIIGETQSGIPFDLNFNTTLYEKLTYRSYYIDEGDSLTFGIQRFSNDKGSIASGGLAFVRKEDELKIVGHNFRFEKLTKDGLITWYDGEAISSEITNFLFDRNTGLVKGEFALTIEKRYEDITRNVLITGNFKVHVVKLLED